MKRWAMIVGVVFVIAGIAGFIPALCPNGLLFGLFAVNTMHNIVHIASGLVAFAMAAGGENMARNFFRIFGVISALVAGRGPFTQGRAGPSNSNTPRGGG